MHTQSHLCLELEAPPLLEELLIKDGDSGVPSSSPKVAASQKPVKKQTRQWAAWTREEEENFFNALRQVGKNFDKITCRVQSKNKDQVRHYYYRLVRRMNKLLGPGFSLDAKNSKDTNAAMLRWWSLLEKFSCKVSKLRSKPRRFKIFIEALENQLLKDRKKTKRKQPSQGEACSSASSATFSLLSKASGNDVRSLKLVIVDSQNIQKVGSGKGVCLKRSVSTSISSNKGDSSTTKVARQRRRTGPASSAAYKKWEKAAMAGVSLVADAAEQLERTTTETKGCPDQGTAFELPREPFPSNGQKDVESVGGVIHSLSSLTSQRVSSRQQVTTEASIQPSMKLKLQLFPIDEGTRKALEKDEHNPHLELTLSSRKKISSVLEHLIRKWGNSVIASGELMLFPFSIQQENLFRYQRWTLKDTVASAAEVYAAIGSPDVFRLRYGWFSNAELGVGTHQIPSSSLCSDICVQSEGVGVGNTDVNIPNEKDVTADVTLVSASPIGHLSKQLMVSSLKHLTSITEKTAPQITDFTEKTIGCDNPLNHLSKVSERTTAASSWLREDMDNLVTSNGTTLSAGEWADSLTNISFGDLLSEASRATDANCMVPLPAGGSDAPCLQPIPFSCDSFDAAIAAHLSGSEEMPSLPTSVPHSSIWDSEETCDGFSFRKIPALDRDVPSVSGSASFGECSLIPSVDLMGFHGLVEEFVEVRPAEDPPQDCEPKANSQSDLENRDDSTKNLVGLTDIYWPDSLGPLDLDISPARYQGHDLILGDSNGFSGLNRLIASSLDAFQNCSFFNSDKKEPTEGEVLGSASFLDHQIGGKV